MENQIRCGDSLGILTAPTSVIGDPSAAYWVKIGTVVTSTVVSLPCRNSGIISVQNGSPRPESALGTAEGNTVGSGAILDFFGSLDRYKATKGLFVTASTFSSSARQTAEQLSKRIVR
jgi:hypothetical protein